MCLLNIGEKKLQHVTQENARITIRRLYSGFGSGKTEVPTALTNSMGCVLAQNAPKEGRYPKCKVANSGGIAAFIHLIAYLAAKGPGFLADPKREVHHRCHKKRCINPAHLSFITKKQNLAANGCSTWTLKDDGTNPCQHDPQCILPASAADREKLRVIDENDHKQFLDDFGFDLDPP